MRCIHCNYEDKDKFTFCPECGQAQVVENTELQPQPVPQAAPLGKKVGKPLNIIAISLLIFIIFFIFASAATLWITKNTQVLNASAIEADETLATKEEKEESEENKLKEILPVYREITLMPGQTQQIQLYTYPQNADISQLRWESSDDQIKVSSAGYVNSRFPGGQGTITISNLDGTVKTQCKVKVLSEQEAFYNTINLINNGSLEKSQLIDFTEDNFEPGAQVFSHRSQEVSDMFSKINKELSSYTVIQKQLINKATENNIDCDVYIDPLTDDIRKIVTIEYLIDTLEITDYYFMNGKIYFVFRRQENYYRPIAAQQDFPGDRYFFIDDSLVKWREITKNTSQLFEKTDHYYLDQGFSWKTYEYKDLTNVEIEKADYDKPGDYVDIDKQTEIQYKQNEKDMLNSAYNLYNKVLQTPSVTDLTGHILGQDGYPMSGVHVKVFAKDYKMLVAEAITKEDGGYVLKVPIHTTSYEIEINKPGYISTTVYNVDTSFNAVSLFQESIYMYREGQRPYTIRLNLIDALDGANINDAKVIIRRGINNRDGEIAEEFNLSDYHTMPQPSWELYDDLYDYFHGDSYEDLYEEAFYDVQLYPGNYTAEIQSPGYTSTYFTISTIEDGWEFHSSVVPKVKDDEVRIVLSWGQTPSDLDSHLFFPDEQHIGYYNRQVGNSFLDRDDVDSYGPETITISNLNNGIYKYYVSDYTNCSQSNYNSKDMSHSFARVDIYDKNGLIGNFNVPTNRPGVIWHVFNIANGKIQPVQRYYNNIEDMTWWSASKF